MALDAPLRKTVADRVLRALRQTSTDRRTAVTVGMSA